MSLPTASDRQETCPPEAAAIVVRLENVSVRYRVPRQHVGSFKEYMIRRLGRNGVGDREFWAVRDVSLEVRKGEVFGIVGRNGAGKSTLLKVVSRILRPTRGRVRVWGRVAPLLELGAGFHPELTGRENIFLNGALLGRSQQEIHARLNWIIDFAEIGEFIDASMRTYSSGMWARLGFAVASAWEPEILIIDEVLAVGDVAFQEKCQGRMQAFAKSGTTIFMVSHSPAVIQRMCHRAVWLDHGAVRSLGNPAEVTDQYVRAFTSGSGDLAPLPASAHVDR